VNSPTPNAVTLATTVLLGTFAARQTPAAEPGAPSVPPPQVLDRAIVPEINVSKEGRPTFTASGDHFTLCLQDGTVEVREASRGRLVRTFRLPGSCAGASLTDDATRVVAIGTDGAVRVWPTGPGGGEVAFGVGETDRVRLSPDGQTILVGTYTGPVRQWSVAERREAYSVPSPCQDQGSGASGELQALAFGGDGASWWATCGGGKLTRRDRATGKELASSSQTSRLVLVSDPPGGPLTGVSWNPGNLYVLDAKGSPKKTVSMPDVNAWGASPAGDVVVVNVYEKGLQLWDAAKASLRSKPDDARSYGHGVAVSNGGRAVVASDLYGRTILWRPGAGQGARVTRLDWESSPETLQPFGNDGLVMRVQREGADDRYVRLRTGEPVALPTYPEARPGVTPQVVQLSTDAQRVRVVVDPFVNPQPMEVRTLPEGRTLGGVAIVECVHCPVHRQAYASRDLRFVAVVKQEAREGTVDQSVEHIDVLAGWKSTTFSIPPDRVNAVELFPDGRRLLLLHEGGAMSVWDVAKGERVGSFSVEGGGPRSVSLVDDGRTLAVLRWDGTVDLVDVVKGEATTRIDATIGRRYGGQITRLVEGPGGKRLLLGDDGGAWWVWDPAAGRAVGHLIVYPDGSWVALDERGRVGATGSAVDRLYLVTGLDAGPLPEATRGALSDPQQLWKELGLDG